MFFSHRRPLVILVLISSLAFPAFGIGAAIDEERFRVPDHTFDVLENASRRTPVELKGIPLKDGLVETVLVHEFDVFTPDARIHVIEGDRERIETPPEMRFFKGEVLGHPGSWAVFTRTERGLGGLIGLDGEVYSVDGNVGSPLYTRRVDDDELPEAVKNWSCEADKYHVPDIHEERIAQRSVAPVTGQAFTATTMRRLKIAVDTDYELTQIVGSTGAVTTYVANVTAAVSVIYENDLNTVLQVGDVFTYGSAADPWTAGDSSGQLDEVGTYWHNTPSRASIGRSTVIFISGKDTGGGVAWVGVLCRDGDFEQDFFGKPGVWGGGYAVWGGVSGAPTTDPNAAGYWDVLAYAHELGHNAGSDHTHCIQSTGYGRTFVDECRSGEDASCWNGAETVPAERGTVMSYCHLLQSVDGPFVSSNTNVRLIFGKAGEASEAVLPPMTGHIDGKTLTGTLTSPSTSVDGGSAGNTATFAVTGATSWVWELTNGTITAGQGTSVITFTAGSSGQVDFRVTAANAKGCGAIATGSLDIIANNTVQVTSVTPNSGPEEGGTAVTIAGTNFENGATVTFGGDAATNVVYVNSTSLTAVTPAHAPGAVAVTVTNPGSESGTLTGGFTYQGAGGTPGDANKNGGIDTGDIFYLINHLFAGGPAPVGDGDANGNGGIDTGDIFFLINHLFAGGPAPTATTGGIATASVTGIPKAELSIGSTVVRRGVRTIRIPISVEGASVDAVAFRVASSSAAVRSLRVIPPGDGIFTHVVPGDRSGSLISLRRNRPAGSVGEVEVELDRPLRAGEVVELTIDPAVSAVGSAGGGSIATTANGALSIEGGTIVGPQLERSAPHRE